MALADTLTKKVGPLPLWAYGAGAAVGAAGLVLIARRSSGGSSGTAGDSSGSDAGDPGSGAGFGGGGGSDPGTGTSPGTSGSGGLIGGVIGGGNGSSAGTPSGGNSAVTSPQQNPSPRSDTPNRELVTAQPIATIGGGALQSIGRIINPVGYADNQASQPQNIYTPSPLDYASERLGGVMDTQVSGEGRSQGQTSTIYTNSGGGAVPGGIGPVLKRISDFPVGEKLTPVAGGYQRVG